MLQHMLLVHVPHAAQLVAGYDRKDMPGAKGGSAALYNTAGLFFLTMQQVTRTSSHASRCHRTTMSCQDMSIPSKDYQASLLRATMHIQTAALQRQQQLAAGEHCKPLTRGSQPASWA